MPSCQVCGAPLALLDEPAPVALDRPLDLDRRHEPRPSGSLAGAPSAWEMDAPAPSRLGVPPPRPPPVPRRGGPQRPARPAPPRPVPHPAAPPAPLFEELAGPPPPAFDAPPTLGTPLTFADPPALGPLPDLGARSVLGTPPAAPPHRIAPAARRAATPRPAAAREEARVEVHRERAAPWRRAAAWGVDLAIVAGTVALLLLPVMGRADLPAGPGFDAVVEALGRRDSALVPALLLAVLVAFAYQWTGTALAGATPGKWVAGLRVVGPDGRRPSPGRSAVRSAVALPSFALLGLGALFALFTDSGRALHDFAAGTWVVRAHPGAGEDAP